MGKLDWDVKRFIGPCEAVAIPAADCSGLLGSVPAEDVKVCFDTAGLGAVGDMIGTNSMTCCCAGCFLDSPKAIGFVGRDDDGNSSDDDDDGNERELDVID